MSGSVHRYNPQSRTFTPQGPDGRWRPKGVVRTDEERPADESLQAEEVKTHLRPPRRFVVHQ